jgi:GNAT superfamily N-acetyltransferase
MTDLIPATAADAPALSRLMEETFRAAYGHVASEDKLVIHIRQQYNAGLIAERLAAGEIGIWFVPGNTRQAADALGYLQLGWRAPVPAAIAGPALELQRCYLRPEAIGGGAGATLIEMAKAQARAREAGLFLSVYKKAPRAVRFYQKHGFVPAADVQYYIADVAFDDWLMAWPAAISRRAGA